MALAATAHGRVLGVQAAAVGAEADEGWTRARIRVLIAAYLFGVALATNFTNHAALLPMLTETLGFEVAEAGLITSTFFVGETVVLVLAGALADRFGPKVIGLAGLLLAALTTGSIAWVNEFAGLLVLKGLAGCGVGAAFVSGTRYSGAFFGSSGRTALGLFGGAVLSGAALGLYAMPLLATALGWRGAFLAATAFCTVAALVWARVPDVGSVPGASPFVAFGRAVAWGLGVVQLATFGLAMVLGAWVTVYFVAEFGLDLSTAGAFGALLLVLGTVGRTAGGPLATSGLLGSRSVIRLSLLLNLVGLVAMAVPGRPIGLAVLGLLLLGLGVSIAHAAVYASAASALPDAPGAAQGLVSAVSVVGVVPASTLVGWLFAATGGFLAPIGMLEILVLAGFAASARMSDVNA